MEHTVKIIRTEATRYGMGITNKTRPFEVEIDGVITKGVVIISYMHSSKAIKYVVKLDNKEIRKHTDWRLIRSKILMVVSERFSGMDSSIFHRERNGKDKSSSPNANSAIKNFMAKS